MAQYLDDNSNPIPSEVSVTIKGKPSKPIYLDENGDPIAEDTTSPELPPVELPPIESDTNPEEPFTLEKIYNTVFEAPKFITDPATRFAESVSHPGLNDSELGAQLKGFAGGAVEGASQLLSPANILTLGRGRIPQIASRIIGGMQAGHGVKEISEGNIARGLGDIGIGAITGLSGGNIERKPNIPKPDLSPGSIHPVETGWKRPEIMNDIAPPSLANGGKLPPADLPVDLTVPKEPTLINEPKIPNEVPPIEEPQLNPIQKLSNALKEAKPLNKEQAKIYSAERAQRVGEAEGVTTKGLAGHYERLGKFKGEHTKVQMEPLKLEQNDVDSLVDTIESHPSLMRYQKVNATEGLIKVLDGRVPQDNEINLLEQVFGRDMISEIRSQLPKIDTKRSLVSEVVNLPRALQSAYDISFPFRQGLGLIHTRGWWSSWGDMLRAYGSEKSYRGTMESILSRPNYRKSIGPNGVVKPSFAERAGLALTDLTDLTKREEAIMSTVAEKVPGVRAGNRAYTAFANKLRADTFDSLIKQAEEDYQLAKLSAKTPDQVKALELMNPRTNLGLAREIASYVNNASGRGNLGKLERSAVALNSTLFSPRLMASRLQMMNPKNYIFTDPFVRKQYLKSLLSVAGTWTTMASLAKMAGAEVSTDTNSADFGKIKIGDTRLDPAGGFQQYLVLFSRLASGKYTTGKQHTFGEGFGAQTKLDALENFVQNKLAPVPSYAAGYLGANNYRPFDVTDRTLRLFTPMVLQDLSELVQEDPNLIPGIVPGMVGMGVQSYGERGNDSKLFGPNQPELLVK